MPGDAGSAIIHIIPKLDNSLLDDVASKVNTLDGKTCTINIKVNDNASSTISDLGKSIKGLDITKGMKDKTGSLGLSKITESVNSQIDSLNSAINGFKDSFKGFNLELKLGGSNPVARNAQYGREATKTIEELKNQATQLENFYKEYYKLNDNFSAGIRAAGSTGRVKDIANFADRLFDSKASYTKQMDVWREYISLMQEAASINNLDISSVTNGFSKNADQLVADTEKILSGEADIEKMDNRLKNIFGSVDASTLTSQLDTINESIRNVVNAINSLGESKQNGFDNLANDMREANQEAKELSNSIKEVNQEEEKSSTGATSKSSENAIKYGSQVFKAKTKELNGYLKAYDKNVVNYNKFAEQSDFPVDTLNKYTESINKLRSLKEELDAGTLTPKGYADVANQEMTNISNLTTELDNYVVARKEANRAEKEAIKLKPLQQGDVDTGLAYEKAVTKIEKAQAEIQSNLQKWTAARNGKSSDAYKEYAGNIEALRALNAELRNGALNEEQFQKRFDGITQNMKKNSAVIQGFGENTLSVGDKLKRAWSTLGTYFSGSMLIMKGVQAVKQMVQASMDIESAMNRIQIVTGATDSQMTQFFDTASNQAQELGKNITDVAGSIETFSRLGFNLGEAENLSKFATIMSNVADTSIDEATTGLTSIIKGFGLEAKDAEHVSDVLIDVGQKYAISASELMQSFERGGAALHASGASFEESAALFAATNAALQNASTTGTMWKTVSARLRGATSELKDMGEETDGLAQGLSKYRDELIQLSGVDIMKNASEYKNPYQIFTELAENWDKINGDPAKARVAEILGGTRQLSGIMSTITNIKDAMGAYETATNSAGVAMKANDKYMETTAAHVGKLKASFQELSYDMINGDLMKGVVDLGKGSLNTIDGIIDRIGTLSTALSSISLSKFAKNMSLELRTGSGMIEALTNSIKDPFTVITGGLALASGLYNMRKQQIEEMRVSASSASESFDQMSKNIDTSISSVVELRDKLADSTLTDEDAYAAKKQLLDIQNQLIEQYPQMAEGINLVTGNLETQIGLMNDLKRSEAERILAENNEVYKTAEEVMTGIAGKRNDVFGKMTEGFSLGDFKTNKDYAESIREIVDSYDGLIELSEMGEFGYLNISQDVETTHDTLVSFIGDLQKLQEAYPDSKDIERIINISGKALDTVTDQIETFSKDYDDLLYYRFLTDDKNYRWIPKNGEADTRKAIDWIDDYRKAVEEYNDALLSGDTEKIAETKGTFEYIDKALTGLVGLGGKFSNYAEMIQEIRDQVQESLVETNKLQDTLDNSMMSPYVDNVKGLNITQDAFRNFLLDYKNGLLDQSNLTEEAQTTLKGFISALGEMGIAAFDASGNINEELVSALINLSAFAVQDIESTEQAASTLESFGDYQSTLASAMNASASATGLTTEQINGLADAYKDIDGYDPAKLFESTANGIHLNQQELERLNKEIELNKLDEYHNKIQKAIDDYNDLNDARKRGENISDQQLQDAYDNIQSLKREESQYEGLISAFNKWQISKSQTDERANYEAIGSGYEGIKDLVEHGWINDAEVGSYLDLVLGKVDAIGNVAKRSGDNLKDFAKLTETNEYGHNIIGDYWSYSEDGKLNPGGLQTFLEDVNQFDSSIVQLSGDADNTNAVINFTGDNLARVSKEFGLSAEMIQLMERAMVDAGAAMVLDSDNISLMGHQMEKLDITSSGLSESMQNALSSHDWENLENWDLSELEQAATQLDSAINQLGEDAGDTKELFSALQDSVAKQTIRAQVQLEMEQSGKSIEELAGLSDADLAEEFKINIDTSEGQAQLEALKGEIDSMAAAAEAAKITVKIDEGQFDKLTGKDQDMTVKVNYEDGSGEKPQETMDMTVNVTYTDVGGENPKGSSEGGEAKHIPVIYDVTPAEEPKYEDQNPVVTYTETHPPEPIYRDQTPSVTYSLSAPPEPSYNNISRTVTYTIQTIGSPPGGGTATAYGTMLSVARADGSMANGPWNWVPAYSKGSVALGRDEYALTNELGQESIIRNGQWMMLPGGMHMEALKKGDIVLSAAQTEALLRTGKASGHAHAYALGTLIASAYGNSSLWKGDSGSWNYNKSWSNTNKYASSSSSSSGSGSKSSGGGNNNSDNKSEDEEPEIFDWIELAIDRIERAIKQLGITAKSTFKTLTTRLEANAEEIKVVTDEIELQQKAYERYIQQANSVGLSEELAERVRNGAIDINEYDKETQELIDKYQEWYEKALDCDDAIQQLHEDLGQLYEDRFTDTKDDFDAQLDMLEHMINTFENGMDDIEARGYLMTTKYYEAMRDVERQNIDVMNKELDALTEKMSQAVNSGEIKEGSQAWYDMQRDINDVKEAIQKAETSVIEFGNSIRETLWDRFDYLQDRITEITDEAEFMIDLMDFSKLYDDQGQLTNTGMATMGLHGMNYNVMMNQADRYAAEIKKINKELANDPYNTKLLEQRQEWIESQRDSILNAEEEKQAIVDMVEEGIRLELDALNEVINKYKESLDTAKSLADYQKKVKEQSDNISTIQKRISAYAGDNSEESRSTIQKLNTDLTKAIETLQDTQENRRISETKEMLSNLYDQYEMTLNQRLDDVDALISDMISTINSNAGNIDTTIKNEAKDVGYTLSEAMRNIWTTDGKVSSVITLYGDNFVKFGENFNGALTTVNEVILRIAEYVAKMAGASDKEAKARIKETTPTTKTNKAAKPVTPPAPKKVNKPAEKKQDAHTDQEKYGVAIAIWNGLQGWGGGQDRKNKLESKGFNYDEIQGIVNKIRGDILSNSWSGKYYGITGADISKYAYNKFKSGGIVDYTGLAQVDGTPGRPESFLNAKDTYNFTVLKDLLDKAIHGGNHGIDLFAGITGISKPNGIKNSMFGDITYQINIPIDHVENYDDFVNKMRSDGKFEKLIQSMTIDQMAGRGSLSKNKYKW